ncbi:MAG: hypothetical protein MAG453_02098 [Calditrichaeota bacterium]|nr:hypothetical protein [Calditrichota bacterium]
MNPTLDFLSGPVFRICFSLMLLGLVRVSFLSMNGTAVALRRSRNRTPTPAEIVRETAHRYLPERGVIRRRPVLSAVAVIWHVGIVLVPLFHSAHVLRWKLSVGFSWPALPQDFAHGLTIATIAAGLLLILSRLFSRALRALRTPSGFPCALILLIPFATGFTASNFALSASAYQWIMGIHLVSANLIMLAIPFTRLSHCVLVPLGQLAHPPAWAPIREAGKPVFVPVNPSHAEAADEQ